MLAFKAWVTMPFDRELDLFQSSSLHFRYQLKNLQIANDYVPRVLGLAVAA